VRATSSGKNIILPLTNSQGSSLSIVTRLRVERSRFNSFGGGGQEFYVFATAATPALGPTQPPFQWVLLAVAREVKRLGREADYSPPSSAELKNELSYTSTPSVRLGD
jgi:hypothetical protein